MVRLTHVGRCHAPFHSVELAHPHSYLLFLIHSWYLLHISHTNVCKFSFLCGINLPFIIDDKPKFRDAFRNLLSLANKWRTIGALLGVERHVLESIKKDEDGVDDCLQAMLSAWLKQIDPLPTWKELSDAVEKVDVDKALEIRKHIAG